MLVDHVMQKMSQVDPQDDVTSGLLHMVMLMDEPEDG
jgi:hypothetical protein